MIRKEELDEGTITSGHNNSIWVATTPPIKFEPLQDNISVDVVIIGGGVAGISIAYCLSKEGKKVAVLEDGYIGSGETGKTTAHITYALDDRYFKIIKKQGEEAAKLSADSNKGAIDFIESTIKKEKISCDFERVNGYLFKNPNDPFGILEKELDALHSIGYYDAELIDSPLEFEKGKSLLFPRQAQFHPLKYLKGMSNLIIKNKGQIFTQTHAQKIKPGKVETRRGNTILTKKVVIATHAPINDIKLSMQQAAYRTFVIAARTKKSVSKGLYWDTNENSSIGNAYHYARTHKISGNQYLIVGGEDHKTGQGNSNGERFHNLSKWAQDRFDIGEIEYMWSGQIMEPADSMAYIGRYGHNTYVATGDSGNGITRGTIAGILITDLIMRKENKWAELYDPSRISFSSQLIKENLNVAKEYIMGIAKRETPMWLQREEGAVWSNGNGKIAVYKDENGAIHEFSAVCPHMKGILTWNSSEKTFDCPCHGSRFTCKGKVINGPANNNLEMIRVKNEKLEVEIES